MTPVLAWNYTPQKAQRKVRRTRAIALLSLVAFGWGLTACRPNAVSDEPDDLSASPQAWSAAQTQGKLQPFPPRLSIRLQRLLNHSVGDGKLPGVVLYIATSDGVWMGASGQADLKNRTILKPTDRFRIASLTELFTAVICLQLVEAGELDLDKSIAHYLPDDAIAKLGNVKPAIKPGGVKPRSIESITVRQLLNHTSGLADLQPEALKQAAESTPKPTWTAKKLLDFLPERPEQRQVNWSTRASTNYLLLQIIVERVTGQPLGEVLRDRIVQPLKLGNTFLESQKPIPNSFVQGYQDWNNDGKLEDVTQPLINTGLGMGDRGIISNAPDVARFFQTLFTDDKLLKPSSLAQMLTLVPVSTDSYGLGIVHSQTRWGEAWGQAGMVTGFSSVLLYLPVHDLTLVVWTNDGDRGIDHPYEIVEKSLEIILGDP